MIIYIIVIKILVFIMKIAMMECTYTAQTFRSFRNIAKTMVLELSKQTRLFERSETGSRGDPHEVWGDFLNPSVARTRDVVPIRHVCAGL